MPNKITDTHCRQCHRPTSIVIDHGKPVVRCIPCFQAKSREWQAKRRLRLGVVPNPKMRRLPRGTPRKEKVVGKEGYIYALAVGHPRANRGRVLEHILVVESVLGKPIPKGAHIHHVNRNRADNRNCNLVVCQDTAYHQLIERRTRALIACGNANWRKCCYCPRYDDPANMIDKNNGRGNPSFAHRECWRRSWRESRDRRKALPAHTPDNPQTP